MRERAHELFGAADYGAALGLYRDLVAATGAGQRRGSVQDELLGASDLFYMGLCFSRLGQHDQAIEPMRQSVEIFERHWRGGNWNLIPLYAEVVASLGGILAHLGRADEAIEVTEVAAELRTAASPGGTLALDAGLARALRRFAEVRVFGQRELDRALLAVHDAVRIYGGLAQSPDRAEQERFTEELDETVQLWVDVLEELGRGDEAADVLERLDSHGGRRQRRLDQMWADVLHCIDRHSDTPEPSLRPQQFPGEAYRRGGHREGDHHEASRGDRGRRRCCRARSALRRRRIRA